MSITNTQQAKDFLSKCMDIHQEWIDYLVKYPEYSKESEPIVNIAGDIGHHEDLVRKYKETIELLDKVIIVG